MILVYNFRYLEIRAILKVYIPLILVVVFSSGLNFAPSVAPYVPQLWFLVPICLPILAANQAFYKKRFNQTVMILVQFLVLANLGIIASSNASNPLVCDQDSTILIPNLVVTVCEN